MTGKFFSLKPRFARNVITGLCRIDGWSVGVVASNSMFLGGVLDVAAADKAARFVASATFQIPLLFLQDVPGFMVGTKAEQSGLIRHGARMLQMVSSATVPKLTVVVRKGFGAGYYVMNGRAYEPDLIVAWPDAEIGIIGAEGLVSCAAKKLLDQAESPEAAKTMKEELAAGYALTCASTAPPRSAWWTTSSTRATPGRHWRWRSSGRRPSRSSGPWRQREVPPF